MRDKTDYAEMLEYVSSVGLDISDRQKKIALLMIKHDNDMKLVASKLGMFLTNVSRSLRALRAKVSATRLTITTEKYQVPEHLTVNGESAFLDENDNLLRRWVKSNKEKEQEINDLIEFWQGFFESNSPKAKITDIPKDTNDKLMCDYTIGDSHIGLYAWAEEAGNDWDTLKGVDILRKAVNHLVSSAPNADTAFILDVGDYFHADNQFNETSKSKNKLDVDGRWKKVLEAGLQAVVDLIDMALQKHNKVYYRSVIGNHNEHSAVMINIAMKMRFINEPRVIILDSPSIHNYFQFGVNLLADTHGHTTKPDKLPLIMATDVPKMWAETTNRIWRTGHVHHESVKEYSGCNVITYRTLAPKDAWHAGDGYRSNRDMVMTIYHKERGTVGTHLVNPSMLGY